MHPCKGVLASRCNVALGNVKDSTEHLRKLISYLEKHNARD